MGMGRNEGVRPPSQPSPPPGHQGGKARGMDPLHRLRPSEHHRAPVRREFRTLLSLGRPGQPAGRVVGQVEDAQLGGLGFGRRVPRRWPGRYPSSYRGTGPDRSSRLSADEPPPNPLRQVVRGIEHQDQGPTEGAGQAGGPGPMPAGRFLRGQHGGANCNGRQPVRWLQRTMWIGRREGISHRTLARGRRDGRPAAAGRRPRGESRSPPIQW